MPIIDINSDEIVSLANKLEKMHRSDFPIAVRGTINKAALNMKQDTLMKTTKDAFNKRHQGNFYKAMSKVNFATGFDVDSMGATVGFSEKDLKGNNNYAVKDLEQQERGGKIKGRSFLAMDKARKTKKSPVKDQFRLSELKSKDFVNAEDINSITVKGKSRSVTSKQQKYIVAAIVAKRKYGANAFVLGNKRDGKRTLSLIDEVFETGRSKQKGKSGRSTKVFRTPLYSYVNGFAAKVKPKNYAKRAAHETGLNINKFFIQEAQRRFDKALRK